MKNISLLLLMFLSVSTNSIGQVDGATNSEEGPRLNDNRVVVKFSPMQMIVGEFDLGVEFQTSQKTSLEIDLGPTISNVGFSRLSYVSEDGNNVTENTNIGFFGSLGFRYYPLDKTEALNRVYVSPVLKYRLYNYRLSEDSGNLNDQGATKTQLKFLFNFGYELWASKSFAFDFFVGMGIGYQETTNYNAMSLYENFEYTYFWERQTTSRPQMLMNLGVKIGIGK